MRPTGKAIGTHFYAQLADQIAGSLIPESQSVWGGVHAPRLIPVDGGVHSHAE
jgi:hypothetical protein